jgi:hypothetical protein
MLPTSRQKSLSAKSTKDRLTGLESLQRACVVGVENYVVPFSMPFMGLARLLLRVDNLVICRSYEKQFTGQAWSKTWSKIGNITTLRKVIR